MGKCTNAWVLSKLHPFARDSGIPSEEEIHSHAHHDVLRSHSPKLRDFLGDLPPILVLSGPFTGLQGREDIDHSFGHGFKTGLVEGEWRFVDVHMREYTPWA